MTIVAHIQYVLIILFHIRKRLFWKRFAKSNTGNFDDPKINRFCLYIQYIHNELSNSIEITILQQHKIDQINRSKTSGEYEV